MLAWITAEVKKLLQSTHAVSQNQLLELEERIKMEAYLREKKAAIL